MLKIRRSRDRFIFNMGIPMPRKDGLYIETGPRTLFFSHSDFNLYRVVPNSGEMSCQLWTPKIDTFWWDQFGCRRQAHPSVSPHTRRSLGATTWGVLLCDMIFFSVSSHSILCIHGDLNLGEQHQLSARLVPRLFRKAYFISFLLDDRTMKYPNGHSSPRRLDIL